MSSDELLDVLVAEGIDLGPDAQDLLADTLEYDPDLFLPLCDDRWAWLPALLDGRIFTHRLSAQEVEHDLICIDADLAPLSMLTENQTYQRLTDGSAVADVSPLVDGDVLAERGIPAEAAGADGALLFEPGRFAGLGVAAGDLVALHVTARGFELTGVEALRTSEIGAALDALLAELSEEPVTLDAAIWTLCADDDALFREPVAPLHELLSESGLALDGDWVAPAGFDFGGWRLDGRIESITSRYQVTDDEAFAVVATVRLYEQVRELVEAVTGAEDEGDPDQVDGNIDWLPQIEPAPTSGGSGSNGVTLDEDRATIRSILEFLAEPTVAAAVVAETGSGDDHAAAALGLFAEAAEPLAPRDARPALRWMRGIAHERLGDVEQAERTFEAAESLDPTWPLTLMSLARYASDRGDATRGLALLRRAGLPPDHSLVQLLEHFQPVPRTDIGRNEPCWCGSGRKYKVCHLHREQVPLAERAAWLYQKAGRTCSRARSPRCSTKPRGCGRCTGTRRTGSPRRSKTPLSAMPCCSREARSASSSPREARCCRMTSGCLPGSGCSLNGRCTRWFRFAPATE